MLSPMNKKKYRANQNARLRYHSGGGKEVRQIRNQVEVGYINRDVLEQTLNIRKEQRSKKVAKVAIAEDEPLEGPEVDDRATALMDLWYHSAMMNTPDADIGPVSFISHVGRRLLIQLFLFYTTVAIHVTSVLLKSTGDIILCKRVVVKDIGCLLPLLRSVVKITR